METNDSDETIDEIAIADGKGGDRKKETNNDG